MNNLDIWNRVEQSDPKFLKQVSFGARSFTAIDPMYQIRCATAEFGPIGKGWGWINQTRFIDLSNGDKAVVADVQVWHGELVNAFGPFTGCRKFFDAAKGRMAEDAPKMAITDGLTKALSHIGCDADIFLGKMDGNKYDQDSGNKSSGW